jgi:Asp-tRNA(Asn)/Glu-tRNA(Gln) amidotransferase B subunit
VAKFRFRTRKDRPPSRGRRGRPKSLKNAEALFLNDPNRVAAAIAADWIAERAARWNKLPWAKNNRRKPPHKISREDGTTTTLHDAAADYGIAQLKQWHLQAASKDAVKRLLRTGRTDWPPDDGSPSF